MNTVTVPAVMKSLGFEPDHDEATSIGAECRQKYVAVTGTLPMKALAPKSSGQGTRASAVYPDTFVPFIEPIVRKRQCLQSMQRDLFND